MIMTIVWIAIFLLSVYAFIKHMGEKEIEKGHFVEMRECLELLEKKQAIHGFSSLSLHEREIKYQIEKVLAEKYREDHKWDGAAAGMMAGTAWIKYMNNDWK